MHVAERRYQSYASIAKIAMLPKPAPAPPNGTPADDWAASPPFVQHAFVASLSDETLVAEPSGHAEKKNKSQPSERAS